MKKAVARLGCGSGWHSAAERRLVGTTLMEVKCESQDLSVPVPVWLRIPALDELLEELQRRHGADGAETVLVNKHGRPWTGDCFTGQFNRVREPGDIADIDEDTGTRGAKHLHPVRGTFATKLMTETALSDQQIADIMGWAPDKVACIRRVYVDQSSVIMAIGERIKRSSVNRAVNR